MTSFTGPVSALSLAVPQPASASAAKTAAESSFVVAFI
jgi:hypothetical protein